MGAKVLQSVPDLVCVYLPLTAAAEIAAETLGEGWRVEVLKGVDVCRRRDVWFLRPGKEEDGSRGGETHETAGAHDADVSAANAAAAAAAAEYTGGKYILLENMSTAFQRNSLWDKSQIKQCYLTPFFYISVFCKIQAQNEPLNCISTQLVWPEQLSHCHPSL